MLNTDSTEDSTSGSYEVLGAPHRRVSEGGVLWVEKTIRFQLAGAYTLPDLADILDEMRRVARRIFEDFYREENVRGPDMVSLTVRVAEDPFWTPVRALAPRYENPHIHALTQLDRRCYPYTIWNVEFVVLPCIDKEKKSA